MRKIEKIILHCSATPEGRDFTVDDIDRWHRKRGFKCIGYHYVIYRDGRVVEGRPLEQIGAHCQGENTHSIGVCYIGGVGADGKTPKDTRTAQQRSAMVGLLRGLMKSYPRATIHGHYEFSRKACPSFNVAALLDEL